MPIAIKTPRGYLAAHQLMKPSNGRQLTWTQERASARWFATEARAKATATRFRIPAPVEYQRDID